MLKSPCHTCGFKESDKRNPACENCEAKFEYLMAINGGLDKSIVKDPNKKNKKIDITKFTKVDALPAYPDYPVIRVSENGEFYFNKPATKLIRTFTGINIMVDGDNVLFVPGRHNDSVMKLWIRNSGSVCKSKAVLDNINIKTGRYRADVVNESMFLINKRKGYDI